MNQNYIIGLIAIVIIGAGGYLLYSRSQPEPALEPNSQNVSTTTSDADSETPTTTQIQIALLNTTGEGTGKSRGCDTVTMVTRTIRYTPAPLTAALQELFAMPEGTQPSSEYNFIARTKGTLTFDKVTITNGTANVYLTGELSGLAGVCDDPRAQIQIEETALQFPTVKNVQIFLNGKATNLTPSGQGE
jgi:spore germination protein GerM